MQNLYITITQMMYHFPVSVYWALEITSILTLIFAVPPPKFYVQLNPIQIIFDLDSCVWFNSFVLNLYQSLLDSKQDISASDFTYIDVKVEAILPRVCMYL